MLIEITVEEQFECLKNEYIANTELLVSTLQDLHINDLKDTVARGELALAQSLSSTSFMKLCKFVFEHSINRETAHA